MTNPDPWALAIAAATKEVERTNFTTASAGSLHKHNAIKFALANRIRALPRPSLDGGWQDISTAPKDGAPILVGVGDYWPDKAWWTEKGGGAWIIAMTDAGKGIRLLVEPTHWMPLPEPPALTQTSPPDDGKV